jgi:hypothetical protein
MCRTIFHAEANCVKFSRNVREPHAMAEKLFTKIAGGETLYAEFFRNRRSGPSAESRFFLKMRLSPESRYESPRLRD